MWQQSDEVKAHTLKLVPHAELIYTTCTSLPRFTNLSSLKTHHFSSYFLHTSLLFTKLALSQFLTSKINKNNKIMADRDRDRDRDTITRDTRQVQVHPQHMSYGPGPFGRMGGGPNGPSASQLIALVTLVPVSGTLLLLAGLTLVGSVIGLAIATPVFILFSPVIVPAALLMALAVTGFLSSGAFGLTGLSALSRITNYLMKLGQNVPEELDYAKRRVADAVAYTGQKTKDVGQTIESKARESGTTGRT
ncbi:hypothetical protein RND81_03G167800 [Saponaria officinalis]|uniref:Oleosin n=1 Tax=Saponaria officinalis TaxID=3572 RepID=A0AAW1M9N8_SAPOF